MFRSFSRPLVAVLASFVGVLVALVPATAAPSVAPTWSTTFDNFHTSGWNSNYGLTSDTQMCQGASGSFNCNWGYSNLQPVSDPTAPGGGQALKVTYPAPSGPPSCNCNLGGGQMYQDLTKSTAPGAAALAASPTVDLKYYYNFPVGFDFGKKTAGKMPGLWGGGVPGCESGGQHCANGWSTRYMWRGGSSSAPNGELYFYTASGGGFGADLCLGNWTFPADGKWHAIEQLVNINTGSITVWNDGGSTPVCQTTQTLPGANSGVFFSTFHGGHDTSWSPSHTTTDEFADFTLATGQQTGGNGTPAVPTNPTVTGTTNSSISLSWTETDNSDPAASYKVYEGNTVVATSTTKSATVSGLAAGSTHTYAISAVDAAGVESAKSTTVQGTTTSATGPATPTGLTVSGPTSTSLNLSWTETNNSDPATSYKVYEGGTVVATSTTTSTTVSGLSPGTSHTYSVTAVDSAGVESGHSATASGTTTGATGPATPTGLTVSGPTNTSLNLSWTETDNSDPAASYNVYEGNTVVTTSTSTSATVTGLTPGTQHTYSVTAVDSAGVESGHSATASGTTTGGGGGGSATVTIAKTKDWGSGYTDTATVTNNSSSAINGWNVQFDLDPSENIESSAGVTYSSSGNHFTLTNTSADATIASGSSLQFQFSGDYGDHYIAPTNVTFNGQGSGPTSPAVPTNPTVTGATSSSIDLSWTETNNGDPAASYKVYEGSTVVATSTTTTATVSGLAAGTSHTFTISAVDAAGGESQQSTPVSGRTGGGTPGPAVPTNPMVTGTTTSSISLSWTENNNSDPATSYKVYEGSTVVATSTTTSATVSGLNPGTTHTYTIAAFDSSGTTSGQSAPIQGTTQGGSTGPATPTNPTVASTTTSSISLSWTENNNSDPATSYNVYEGSTVVATSTTTSATITGLAANSNHTYTITAVDSAGVESPTHSAPIQGTTQGGTNKFNQTDIDNAVAAPLFHWAAPTSAVPRPGTNPVNIGESKVVYYLALVAQQQPGTKATNGTTVDSALLAQVRNMIAGGNEPDSDGGLEMWGQAPIAQALLLLKNSPAWSALSSADQNKVTLLEAAMGYGSNYTYNDANNFSSGICGFGNFKKTNNPNYRDGGVDNEIAAIQFFGASTWDSMLTGFNDSTVASQLNAAGLTNSGGCFTTVGSGGNSAIARPFVYSGHHSSDLMGIWNSIAGATFDQTAASTVGPAHIADGTTSPEDGQCCMGHEFNSTDSAGLRSSALYVFEGWMNVTGSRVTMSVLGNFNTGTAVAPYHIGSMDLIYKLHHGYLSYGLNQNGVLTDDHGDPATDGPNVKGYQYDLDGYNVIVAPQG